MLSPTAAFTDQRIFRDLRDNDGRTALHLAALMDRDAACKTLLDLGSDPGAAQGWTEGVRGWR